MNGHSLPVGGQVQNPHHPNEDSLAPANLSPPLLHSHAICSMHPCYITLIAIHWSIPALFSPYFFLIGQKIWNATNQISWKCTLLAKAFKGQNTFPFIISLWAPKLYNCCGESIHIILFSSLFTLSCGKLSWEVPLIFLWTGGILWQSF